MQVAPFLFRSKSLRNPSPSLEQCYLASKYPTEFFHCKTVAIDPLNIEVFEWRVRESA